MIHPERRRENLKKIEEMDRETVISTFEKIISVCKEDGCDFVDLTFEDAEQILALLKEQDNEIDTLKTLLLGYEIGAIKGNNDTINQKL